MIYVGDQTIVFVITEIVKAKTMTVGHSCVRTKNLSCQSLAHVVGS